MKRRSTSGASRLTLVLSPRALEIVRVLSGRSGLSRSQLVAR